MSLFRKVDLGTAFPPYTALRDYYGFVPEVFACQSLLPRLIEAEGALAAPILFKEHALSRIQKERLQLALAVANSSVYWATAHYQTLNLLGEPEQRLESLLSDYREAGLPARDCALIDFVLNLAAGGRVAAVLEEWTPEAVLEAILLAALANSFAIVADRTGASPDFEPVTLRAAVLRHPFANEAAGPSFRRAEVDESRFPRVRECLGFFPDVFRVQGLRPDAIAAEAHAVELFFGPEEPLSRAQKLRIARGEEPPPAEPAGLQSLEAIAITGFARFMETLQFGLGADREFVASRRAAGPEKNSNLSAEQPRPTALGVDPDAETVVRVQSGDVDAFEDLIGRHSRRVYRTLLGILGNPEEAHDAMQDTFLKAFQHLGDFQGRSKFSTWLVSIAGNTAVQMLRERRPVESLEEDLDSDVELRPRQIRAWTDDPEQLYSKAEVRTLVEANVLKLPAKYRVVVMLRDIEQLSIEESAAALGLGISALKSRHLRGRLMLREALTPHFAAAATGGDA